METKTCSGCGGANHTTARSSRPDLCERCRKKESARAWAEKNPEKVVENARQYRQRHKDRAWESQRRSKFMLRYGITFEEYEALLDSQDGKCAICKTPDPGVGYKHFVVDHDHETGRVRGLLCKNCNTGLGMFCDSIPALMAAANYLNVTSDGDDGED